MIKTVLVVLAPNTENSGVINDNTLYYYTPKCLIDAIKIWRKTHSITIYIMDKAEEFIAILYTYLDELNGTLPDIHIIPGCKLTTICQIRLDQINYWIHD